LKESKIIVRLQVLGGMRRQMTHARLFLASSRRRRRAALAPDSFQLPAPLRQPNQLASSNSSDAVSGRIPFFGGMYIIFAFRAKTD
jgi:hypothetical protein